MSGRTSIEWSERSWNPTRGCSMAAGSECGGCLNCYAARQALRMSGPGGKYEGLVRLTENGPRWTGKIVEGDVDAPLHVRAPSRWFVDSMSDLFHESIPDEWIDRAFAVMSLCPQHTFQILTKRAERMRAYCAGDNLFQRIISASNRSVDGKETCCENRGNGPNLCSIGHRGRGPLEDHRRLRLPLLNAWLGVSVEDEPTARLRITSLLTIPASVRWVSYEPALGPVKFLPWLFPDPPGGKRKGELQPGLDWVVIGGESGPFARPFDLAWARNTVAQCRAAGVPVFVKQLGARPVVNGVSLRDLQGPLRDPKGGNMVEWPEDLRVREYPNLGTRALDSGGGSQMVGESGHGSGRITKRARSMKKQDRK